jgi:hypothetical protein
VIRLILKIDIHGEIDQAGLDRLRIHLKLKKQGRLTDDWDETFGKSQIQFHDGRIAKVALYRHSEDGSWTVNVSAPEPGLSTDELAGLRTELVAGITAAGYEANVWDRPTYGPAQS